MLHWFYAIEIDLIQLNIASSSPNPLKFEEQADVLHFLGHFLNKIEEQINISSNVALAGCY